MPQKGSFALASQKGGNAVEGDVRYSDLGLVFVPDTTSLHGKCCWCLKTVATYANLLGLRHSYTDGASWPIFINERS